MKKMPREQLILKAVLLLRTINRYLPKEEQLAMMDKYYSTEQLEDYVEHFGEPQPETSEPDNLRGDREEYYTPSCTCCDYSPGNPWGAPGMSIHDFI